MRSGIPLGTTRCIAYCAPERMTEGTWNLLLIAVHPDYQEKGYGTSILHYIEQMLAARGERLLLIETSSLDNFVRSQAFYLKCGYIFVSLFILMRYPPVSSISFRNNYFYYSYGVVAIAKLFFVS